MASYYLLQRFLNNARLSTAQFKERNGRLPAEGEFGPLVTPMLSQPLSPPVNFTVGNSAASLFAANAALVSGSLAQGVFGDDCAVVRLLYVLQDGGTNRTAWAQNLFLAN